MKISSALHMVTEMSYKSLTCTTLLLEKGDISSKMPKGDKKNTYSKVHNLVEETPNQFIVGKKDTMSKKFKGDGKSTYSKVHNLVEETPTQSLLRPH
jgi:hypothetical protein